LLRFTRGLRLMTTRKVTRSKINRQRVQTWEPRPLNKAEFHELYFTLRVIINKGSISATARQLGLSRKTADRWITIPPTDPHYNISLRSVVMELIKWCQHHKSKEIRQRAREALDHINKYAKQRSFASDGTEHIDDDIDTGDTCARELLEHLTRKSYISTRELRAGKYSSFSLQAYRLAAVRLCLDKRTDGFGDDKVTWYALPGELPAQ
jgi:hypothetical protein